MSEWFHVGQEVECVDDKPHAPDKTCLLKAGQTYTIRQIGRWSHWNNGRLSGVGVWLEEVDRPANTADGLVHPYSVDRFRPLRKRTTSIEVFKALLNPNKEPVEA